MCMSGAGKKKDKRQTLIRLLDGLLVLDITDNDLDTLRGLQVVKECGLGLRGGGRGEDGDAVELVARGEDAGQDVFADVARGAEEEDVAGLEGHGDFSIWYGTNRVFTERKERRD